MRERKTITMRITKLVLEKYKRLMLSNIQRFEYNPSKDMQLLIGSNGSGKSSVLEELTPLPSHHSNFVKGGVKEIHLQHRDSHYRLRSVYNGGSGEHSFIKDDEELNKGGTFAVQRELVEREFRLTRDLHELFTGVTSFSQLSTAKRREWLTRLSPVDLGYAFEVYNRARSLHRDQQGVIKHLTKRMSQENSDLPDEAELNKCKAEIQTLTEKLDRLFQLRQANSQPGFSNSRAFQETLEALVRRAKGLLRQSPALPATFRVDSMEALEEAIRQRQSASQTLQTLLERLTDDHQQLLQALPAKDAQLSETEIAALREQVQALQAEEARLAPTVAAYRGTFPLLELPLDRRPQELLQTTFTEWITLLQTFPDNRDGRFTQERGALTREALATSEAEQRRLENEQTLAMQKLARLKGCEHIVCPSCQHQFQPGVSVAEVRKLEATVRHCGEQLEQLAKVIEEQKSYLEQFDEYLTYVRRFRRLTQESGEYFQPLWSVCLEQRVMFHNPRDHITAATQWLAAMEQKLQLALLRQEREILEHRLRFVDALDRQALSLNDQRRQALEQEIAQKTQELRELQQEISTLQAQQRALQRYLADCAETIVDLEQLLQAVATTRDHLFQQAVVEETKQTQLLLAQVQERLSRAELRDGLLRDIQKQHDDAVQAHHDYGVLVKALSPTDGLIGQYLMGFMQVVVELLNTVIAEVWTYPLEVLPSQVEKDELDYRFPLNVNNGAVISPDIGRGSSSQRDIVDFAFKLLVMKFLQMEDYPLYLDEFGSTFDEQHRQNLIPFINRLLELGHIQQAFYISHFSIVHGAFNQAEVCVLDPTNITVPQVYNQHVKIQ